MVEEYPGSILGAVLFNIFINDLGDKTEWTLKFCRQDETRIVADMPGGCAVIQRDFDRLEKGPDRNLMQFKKVKSENLCLGRTQKRCLRVKSYQCV